MSAYLTDGMIDLLQADTPSCRMTTLDAFCEGYAEDPRIMSTVFKAWDQLGIKQAFDEFHMLTYLPIQTEHLDEVCERAARMVDRRTLTDPVTRFAGKLLEQALQISPRELAEHLSQLERTKRLSKIFFRVDLSTVRQRIELLDNSADELAAILDRCISELTENDDNRSMAEMAQHALEALRREHPEYLDLGNIFSSGPPTAGHAATSFQVCITSLARMAAPGLEPHLEQHLLDEREAVHAPIVEALVRCGTPAAGKALVRQFIDAPSVSQKWIARGLQRVRAPGMADLIAKLRAVTSDPSYWLMMLVAEIRQFDSTSLERLPSEVARVQSYSKTLIDAIAVYARMHSNAEGIEHLNAACIDYLQIAKKEMNEQVNHYRRKAQKKRRRSGQEIVRQLRRNRGQDLN